MSTKKFAVIAVLAMALLASITSTVLADDPKPPLDPKIPLDCGVWADNPVKSGTKVNGTGEISCLTVHGQLRVVVGLRDYPNNRYTSKVKTCYNMDSCSTTATLSYSSGRQWLTDVSGYIIGTSWNAYDTSDWVSIP